MSVLVLRLAAPLQSWGVESRFLRRSTEEGPSKSGLIGLLAAAQGRRRTDPIEDLLTLRMAARLDQPGTLLRDFHTAHHPENGPMPLSERFYWAGAVFTAYLDGDRALLEGLAAHLQNPTFPLYLGRRSCVPTGQLVLGLWPDEEVPQVMGEVVWQAPRHVLQRETSEFVSLKVQADVGLFPGEPATRQMRDVPLSFDPTRRAYGLRPVVETRVRTRNPVASTNPVRVPDEQEDPYFSTVQEAAR